MARRSQLMLRDAELVEQVRQEFNGIKLDVTPVDPAALFKALEERSILVVEQQVLRRLGVVFRALGDMLLDKDPPTKHSESIPIIPPVQHRKSSRNRQNVGTSPVNLSDLHLPEGKEFSAWFRSEYSAVIRKIYGDVCSRCGKQAGGRSFVPEGMSKKDKLSERIHRLIEDLNTRGVAWVRAQHSMLCRTCVKGKDGWFGAKQARLTWLEATGGKCSICRAEKSDSTGRLLLIRGIGKTSVQRVKTLRSIVKMLQNGDVETVKKLHPPLCRACLRRKNAA